MLKMRRWLIVGSTHSLRRSRECRRMGFTNTHSRIIRGDISNNNQLSIQRVEIAEQVDHGVEPFNGIAAPTRLEKQTLFNGRLDLLQANAVRDVVAKRAPRPFYGVRVHIAVERVDNVVGVVHSRVDIIQVHLLQLVISAPTISVYC